MEQRAGESKEGRAQVPRNEADPESALLGHARLPEAEERLVERG